EEVAQPVLLEDLVIDREDCPAGIAEDCIDALIQQRANNHLGAGHPVADRGVAVRSVVRLCVFRHHLILTKPSIGAAFILPAAAPASRLLSRIFAEPSACPTRSQPTGKRAT